MGVLATREPGILLTAVFEEGSKTLKAEVTYQDQTMELPLEARYNAPGAYQSIFYPTKAGDYTFRIYGKIGDTDIDESLTSGPDTFGPVEDPTPLQFPKP